MARFLRWAVPIVVVLLVALNVVHILAIDVLATRVEALEQEVESLENFDSSDLEYKVGLLCAESRAAC